MVTLSTRQRRLLRWLGYPLLALVTFVTTLHLTFPYYRLKEKIIDALSEKYDVSIYEVEPTILPGGLILKTVALKTRPSKPKEEPITILFNQVRIDVGLLGLLRGRYDVDLEADLDGGSIHGNILVTNAGLEAHVDTRGLSLARIPGLADAVGLPMEGGLDASVALNLPKRRWREADGTIKLSCPGCTIGDGEAKIKPKPMTNGGTRRRSAVFSAEGITVPRLALGALVGEIDIKKGVGTVKTFIAKSKDGDLTIEGDIRFKDPFKNSTFPGCMRFRLSDELKQREKNFGNLPDLMRVTLDPDGFANVAMTGTLSDLRWRPRKTCSTSSSETTTKSRPTVTTRPTPPEPPELNRPNPPELDGPGNSGPQLTKDERPEPPPGDSGDDRPDHVKPSNEIKPGDEVKPGDDVAAGASGPDDVRPGDDVRPDDDVRPGDDDDDDPAAGQGDDQPDDRADPGNDDEQDPEDRNDDDPVDDE